jgi:hypothetical protein
VKNISFAGYTFSFWVLTTRNAYEPGDLTVTETDDGLIAKTDALTYGDQSGSTPGLLEVTLARGVNGISWQTRAAHAELIKGIKVAIGPLPLGRLMVPLSATVDLKAGDRGRVFVYPGAGYYPKRHVSSTWVVPGAGPMPGWAAQFALLQGEEGTLYLHAQDFPPRVKKLWIYHRGEQQEIRLYDEADACRRTTEFVAPTWYLDSVADWHDAVDDHRAWMAETYGLRPFEERPDVQPWMKEVGLVAYIAGIAHDGKICHDFAQATQRLEDLAALFPPQRTLVELACFEGRFDHSWPDNAPAEVIGGAVEEARFFETAHRLGFHVMPHLNVWGASFDNPATERWLEHRILDPEGRPITWSFDHDQDEIDEEIFAYISPDVPEWRAELRSKIREAVARGYDTIYMDQVGTFVNDLNHDHYRGLRALFDELREDLPAVQLTCEAPTSEISAALCPVQLGRPGSERDDLSIEMGRRLFGPYIRWFWLDPPARYRGVVSDPPADWWSPEGWLASRERAEKVGALPTLNLSDHRIRLDSDLVKVVLDWARRYINSI